MNTIGRVLILIVVVATLFFLRVTDVRAQSGEMSPSEEISIALDNELEKVYKPYSNTLEELENSSDPEESLAKFISGLESWEVIFDRSEVVYSKFLRDNNPQIVQIARVGLSSVKSGKTSISLYRQAFLEEDETDRDRLFDRADSEFSNAIEQHDEAVGYYNDFTGASAELDVRNLLIVATIVMLVVTIALFVKSRTGSTIEAEVIKGEIYKRLFNSSLWMTVGLGVTAGGLAYALEKGGTYYILYGPVIFGGWELLKGLANYFKNDRQVLASLAESNRKDAIRRSFGKTDDVPVPKPPVKCGRCGNVQPAGSIVCSKCGENIL